MIPQMLIKRCHYLLSRQLLKTCSWTKRMEQRNRLHSYNEAIKALNGLQTNASVLKKAQEERLKKYVNNNVQQVKECLELAGIHDQDLRKIKVIHVSGTKGKGSTCAFTESILRQYGLKTGFYSSPHLVSVTERIRINGQPLSQELFAKHFWQVYNKVVRDQVDKPAYFKFLTILAYHVFIQEKVDVAIIEVGIGGAFDSTNVIERPVATGITLLDYDHVKVLGNTIEEIAWHKAGIMKSGSVAFVNPNQPPAALQVIKERAEEIGCRVLTVPPLESYNWSSFPTQDLGLFQKVHAANASLALQLSRYFLTRTPVKEESSITILKQSKGFQLEWQEAVGLKLCHWPGRSQTVKKGGKTYYLDGAHTEQSMWACRSWFDTLLGEEEDGNVKRVLVFNSTGDRSAEVLFAPLINFPFNRVIFCTNETRGDDMASDNTNLNFSTEYALRRCQTNKETWDRMQKKLDGSHECVAGQVVPYIEDVLKALDDESMEKADSIHIFVTGSLHLVGGVMSFVQPDCYEKSEEEHLKEKQIIDKYRSLNG